MGTAVDVIVIDDDDDHRPLFPPPSSIQVTAGIYSHPFHVPVLDDHDLELRLGPSENTPADPRLATLGQRTQLETATLFPLSSFQSSLLFGSTIDLTSPVDNHEGYQSTSGKRKKPCTAPPEVHYLPTPEAPREVKLTCAICMDTMEEETSTICGHIFCRKCIVEAIRKQKKCPTCRRRLVNSQIHRIYIS